MTWRTKACNIARLGVVPPKVIGDRIFLDRDDEAWDERGVQKLLAKYCALRFG